MGQEVKNPLRAQSKYGLMGSSAKTGKFCFQGSPEHFLDKNAIWDRTPPIYKSIAVYMCGEGSRVQNLQTKLNYLDSFKSYGIFSDFVVPMSSPSSPHCPCHPHIIPIAPRSSPCGLHGCGLCGLLRCLCGLLHCLRGLHPMLSLWSPLSLSFPHRPHII